MRSRTGSDGAGYGHGDKGQPEASRYALHLGIANVGPHSCAVEIFGAVVEHGAKYDHDEGQDEMGTNEPRVELGVNHHGPQDGLQHDAHYQQQGEDDEVFAARCPQPRGHEGNHGDPHQEHGDHAIGILNQGVQAEGTGYLALVTGGPIRATETGAR